MFLSIRMFFSLFTHGIHSGALDCYYQISMVIFLKKWFTTFSLLPSIASLINEQNLLQGQIWNRIFRWNKFFSVSCDVDGNCCWRPHEHRPLYIAVCETLWAVPLHLRKDVTWISNNATCFTKFEINELCRTSILEYVYTNYWKLFDL